MATTEWIPPAYDEYQLSAEVTAYAGHWPMAQAEVVVEAKPGERAEREDEPAA